MRLHDVALVINWPVAKLGLDPRPKFQDLHATAQCWGLQVRLRDVRVPVLDSKVSFQGWGREILEEK